MRRIAALGGLDSVGFHPSHHCYSRGVFMADTSMTGTFQMELPKDLLSEAKRAARTPADPLHVEAWKASWLSRLSELIVGKD